MEHKPLVTLYDEHKGKSSDKWTLYFAEYDRILQEYRDIPVRLLEIGIQNGGSLEIWLKYFPNAMKLVGCDINPSCALLKYEDPRVSVVIGDANSDPVNQKILNCATEFDVIIDDGSHLSDDIIRSFIRYFPTLIDGGVFIVEDMHCSYWKGWKGGLFYPFSSISFFKILADVVNHEHWGISQDRCYLCRDFSKQYNVQIDDAMLQHVHSVQFVNSMCIIRKSSPINNTLGTKVVSGSLEQVVAVSHLKGKGPDQLDQNENPWSLRPIAPSGWFLKDDNIKRNEPCPCGSGKRFKHCHGALF